MSARPQQPRGERPALTVECWAAIRAVARRQSRQRHCMPIVVSPWHDDAAAERDWGHEPLVCPCGQRACLTFREFRHVIVLPEKRPEEGDERVERETGMPGMR